MYIYLYIFGFRIHLVHMNSPQPFQVSDDRSAFRSGVCQGASKTIFPWKFSLKII